MSDSPTTEGDTDGSRGRSGTGHTDPARMSAIRARRRLSVATGVVFGLVPVLWVVELTGPEWLNMALRVLWVVLALGAVVFGLRDIAAGRRGPKVTGTRR